MNWSYRITTLYLSFVLLILTMVIICFNQTSELESKDYYAQELRYQEKIDAMKNANALPQSITYEITQNDIIFSFPSEMTNDTFKGEILFFCPSNSKNDKKIEMHSDINGKQVISKASFTKTAYKLKLSWTVNGKNYYKESVINI